MELDPIGYRQAMPAERDVVIVRDSFVGAGAECWCERQSDLALERVTSDIAHLTANRFEALAFSLPDFDRQQLEEMAVPVGRAGAGSFGAIQQAARNVKPNRTSARRCAC